MYQMYLGGKDYKETSTRSKSAIPNWIHNSATNESFSNVYYYLHFS
jgi:hypothetical protein